MRAVPKIKFLTSIVYFLPENWLRSPWEKGWIEKKKQGLKTRHFKFFFQNNFKLTKYSKQSIIYKV